VAGSSQYAGGETGWHLVSIARQQSRVWPATIGSRVCDQNLHGLFRRACDVEAESIQHAATCDADCFRGKVGKLDVFDELHNALSDILGWKHELIDL
jgi:hypothetical protein